MAFTPISHALSDRYKANKSRSSSLSSQVDAAMVVEKTTAIFAELFGALAVQAKPLYIKNRTLTITCASAAIAQEIRLRQAEIVDKINTELGKKEVDRIRYLA